MKYTLFVLALALAPAASAQEMRRADFLVGPWHCEHTVGDFHGTYTTTFSTALNGKWFRQVYNFPTLGKTGGPAQGEFFTGYDSSAKRWVRWGMLSTGDYWAMTGTLTDRTWTWSYELPVRAQNAAVWTKKSDAEYVIDGPTYPENGTMVTEHHICRKS
jgi:hypothetical protein